MDLIEPALQIGNLLSSGGWREFEPAPVERKTREANRATRIFVAPVKTRVAQWLDDAKPLGGRFQEVLQIELVSMSLQQACGGGFRPGALARKRRGKFYCILISQQFGEEPQIH